MHSVKVIKLMQFKFRIVLLLFILSLVGCSYIPNELKNAEQLIETNPDSALLILQHISPNRYNSDENRALYGLLMIETLDKKKLPLEPDTLLDFSINYYTKHPDGDRLGTCYLYKGRTFKYRFQYEKAMVYYMKVFDEMKNQQNIILSGRANFDLGDIYNIQGDYTAARQKYKNAFDYFSKAKIQLLVFYSMLNIGRTYHDAKDYITADKYYKKILKLTVDSMQQGALYQEMGLNFYDSNNLDSSLYYYKKIISYPYMGNNRAIRYHLLSKIYFDLNKIDSALYYATNSFKYDPTIRTQRECYRIMTNCEFVKGNVKNVTYYMNKYVLLGDSLNKIDAQIKGSYMETMHSTKKEAEANKIQKWISWSIILILTGCFLFLLRYIIEKVKKEKAEIKEVHTEEKIGIHKKVIEDKRAVLQKQIEDRKTKMLAEFKHAGTEEREQQLRNIYTELIHFDDTELFFHEMNKFLNELITKLKNRYSTLNEKEIMLCCYILLHIPTYDMLILFGYKSDDSMKSLKRRLPKKLNLENATLLEDFLLSIVSEN